MRLPVKNGKIFLWLSFGENWNYYAFLLQSFFGLSFGQSADIDIILDNQDDRKMAEIRDENGRKERHYLFFDGESVTGKVRSETPT